MPLATNPAKKIRKVLPDDMGRDPEPAFYFQFMTFGEMKDYRQYCNDAREAMANSSEVAAQASADLTAKKINEKEAQDKVDAADERAAKYLGDNYEMLFDKLRDKLVDWENMSEPFNPARLEYVINLSEAFQLLTLKLDQRPSVSDKKKLGSRSRSSSAKSAKGAKAKKNVRKNSR